MGLKRPIPVRVCLGAAGFSRTLVGFKVPDEPDVVVEREFQPDPRGIEASSGTSSSDRGRGFQPDPRGIEARSACQPSICRAPFQPDPRGIEGGAPCCGRLFPSGFRRALVGLKLVCDDVRRGGLACYRWTLVGLKLREGDASRVALEFQPDRRGIEAPVGRGSIRRRRRYRRTLVGLKLSPPGETPLGLGGYRRTLVGLKHPALDVAHREVGVTDGPSWG